jgi:hypothetical protein
LPAITEDQTSEAGHVVSDLIAGRISDVDAGAVQGIAVTGLAPGNGHWEYSLDDGASWLGLESASGEDALLLGETDRIRFVPDGRNATQAGFSWRAWDRSAGSAGDRADVGAGGGATAWSTQQNHVGIEVTAVNDAPVLAAAAPTLTTLDEDFVTNVGDAVSSLIGDRVADVDSGAVRGIVIVDVDAGNGHWEYSLDGGGTWQVFAPLAPNTGLLLRDSDRVRFMPDSQNATTASFHFRAWDRSAGSAGSVVAVLSGGDDTPYSNVIDVATVHADGVNDAPINDIEPSFGGGERADGTLRQDGVLHADAQLWHDVDFGDPETTFRFQWEVADDAQGTNLRAITGATAMDYAVTAAEIGKFVRVKVYGGDGKVETIATSQFTQVTNQAPVAGPQLVERETTESVPLSFTVPLDAFGDADPEDTLYYTATLADGSPLPGWLTFDPLTRKFSGTPGGGDVGVLNVRVTASDHGLVTASSDFVLRVLSVPVNLPAPPRVADTSATTLAPNRDLSTPVSGFGLNAVPVTGAGSGSSAGTLFGSGAFDAFGLTSVGVDGLLGSNPERGFTSTAGFRIPVEPSPMGVRGLFLVAPMPDRFNEPGRSMSFIVPADTFRHTETDAQVTLIASRPDGRPLPAWLRFDARSGEFSGEPPADFDGMVEVRVTARDSQGNEVVTIFRVHVHKAAQREAAPAETAREPAAVRPGRSGLSAQIAAAARGGRR